jgi:hypothetical protein
MTMGRTVRGYVEQAAVVDAEPLYEVLLARINVLEDETAALQAHAARLGELLVGFAPPPSPEEYPEDSVRGRGQLGYIAARVREQSVGVERASAVLLDCLHHLGG